MLECPEGKFLNPLSGRCKYILSYNERRQSSPCRRPPTLALLTTPPTLALPTTPHARAPHHAANARLPARRHRSRSPPRRRRPRAHHDRQRSRSASHQKTLPTIATAQARRAREAGATSSSTPSSIVSFVRVSEEQGAMFLRMEYDPDHPADPSSSNWTARLARRT